MHNPLADSNSDDVLVRVDHAGKKFCRDLKKSLWYGMKDIGAELLPGRRELERRAVLRPGEFWAVDDVSFSLRRGECLGLIGRNGAGKTTLLKMLNGLIKPDKGRIQIRGRVGALIALGAGFNPILTGRENIYVNGSLLGLRKKEIDSRLEEIVDFAELGHFIDAPVQSYSSGMAVRLGFSIASVLDPDILLLDEVLAVGDIQFQAKCWNRLGELRTKGVAFILVSHQMENIERLSTSVAYLANGSVRAAGDKYHAINAYRNDAQNVRAVSDGSTSRPPAGTGKAKIDKISLLNSDNAPCSSISSGDELRIRVDYSLNCEVLTNPTLELSIRDSGGLLYRMSNKSASISLGNLSKSGCFFVTLACVPSNNEQLSLSFTLWNEEMTELLDWQKNIAIYVTGCGTSSGRVHLPTSWLVKPSATR